MVPHLLYDGDCSFCTGFAHRVERRNPKVVIVPFAEREKIRALAPGLDDERLRASFHLVAEGGQVASGPDALPDLARLVLPGGAAAAWLLRHTPGSPTVLKVIYKWISEHRW